MIFRIPSKAVQYGYIEVPFPADPSATPDFLAAQYVNYVHAFQKEEQAAIKRLQEGVSAPVAASRPVTEEQAQRYLDEGLGGVTALSTESTGMASSAGTEVSDGEALDVGDDFAKDHPDAPWDKPPVDSKPKPWENGSTAPADKPVVDEGW